jgi:bacteriocin-like protein
MEYLRELTDTELDAVSGGAAAAAAGTGTVAVAAATDSPTVSALLFNVGSDVVNNDGPGAIAFTK